MGEYGDRFNNAVATELRAQRARVQVTYAQLMQETGLAKSTLLNYLNGKRDIPTTSLGEICRALHVRPRDIFDAAEEALKEK